jgi:hypothetical protein
MTFVPHNVSLMDCPNSHECHVEEFVAYEVERAHGFLFHRVDETHAIDEFAGNGDHHDMTLMERQTA